MAADVAGRGESIPRVYAGERGEVEPVNLNVDVGVRAERGGEVDHRATVDGAEGGPGLHSGRLEAVSDHLDPARIQPPRGARRAPNGARPAKAHSVGGDFPPKREVEPAHGSGAGRGDREDPRSPAEPGREVGVGDFEPAVAKAAQVAVQVHDRPGRSARPSDLGTNVFDRRRPDLQAAGVDGAHDSRRLQRSGSDDPGVDPPRPRTFASDQGVEAPPPKAGFRSLEVRSAHPKSSRGRSAEIPRRRANPEATLDDPSVRARVEGECLDAYRRAPRGPELTLSFEMQATARDGAARGQRPAGGRGHGHVDGSAGGGRLEAPRIDTGRL